jgi:quercetin dioxygenase-like cupin family protein
MPNFYDAWLGYWDESEAQRERARRNIHEEELAWVETVQDHRAALMIAPETGFKTWGNATMIAEIPPGCHTGRHKHGEEALFIVTGSGFSIIEDVRYDWKAGSTIHVPFGAPHQHFNTGETTVRYVSALAVGLEHFVGLHRTLQLEERGETKWIPKVAVSTDGMRPDGKRCVLHKEQATPVVTEDGGHAAAEAALKDLKFDAEHPLVVGDAQGMMALPMAMHKSEIMRYMRIGRADNDYEVFSVEISGTLSDPPHEFGGKHAHMEAHLYCLDGEGYTEIGDRNVPWKKGTAFQVPGPQTPHRHVNTGDEPMHLLRIAYGIRYYFEKFAKREYPYLFIEPGQSFLKARNVNTTVR